MPKRSGVRPLNPDQRSDLKNQIDDWIHEGVIEPSNSPWESPLVPVKKKDGRTRWVTDLIGLNSQTVKDAYPLANIQENLQKLKGAMVFSSLDAAGAYHAVVIEPDSRDCTAFISPFGTFITSECLLVYTMQAVYTVGCSIKLYLIFLESSGLHIWMTFWPSAKGTGNTMDI